jgi:DNA-binding XRE family transcriptional regulator
MSVKSVETAEPDHLGKAIRKYRRDIGLTQAQLAVALGIAPTSIYRYEAGTSTPDVGALQKLYLHSEHQQNNEAKKLFYDALTDKVGLGLSLGNQGDGASPNGGPSGSIRHVIVQGRPLTPREQLLAVALVIMLRNNLNESSDKMMQILLEPWMKAAKDDLAE